MPVLDAYSQIVTTVAAQLIPRVAALTVEAPGPRGPAPVGAGSGVVFTGEPSGMFDAFDARTGALLWQFQTGSGIHSSPVTYAVRGKQYVAVPVGWGGWLEGFAPKNYGAPRAVSLVVFALP